MQTLPIYIKSELSLITNCARLYTVPHPRHDCILHEEVERICNMWEMKEFNHYEWCATTLIQP